VSSSADIGPLLTLLEREESRRDTAALALKQAQERLAYAQSQLDMLQGYRQEYVARWMGEFSRPATPQIMQSYRDFKGRLEHAVSQQQDSLQQRTSWVERCREALVEAETRAAAVRKLIERRLAERAREEQRRERRQEDEFARQAAWRSSALDTLTPID
jgi:flagellar FliJ protein